MSQRNVMAAEMADLFAAPRRVMIAVPRTPREPPSQSIGII